MVALGTLLPWTLHAAPKTNPRRTNINDQSAAAKTAAREKQLAAAKAAAKDILDNSKNKTVQAKISAYSKLARSISIENCGDVFDIFSSLAPESPHFVKHAEGTHDFRTIINDAKMSIFEYIFHGSGLTPDKAKLVNQELMTALYTSAKKNDNYIGSIKDRIDVLVQNIISGRNVYTSAKAIEIYFRDTIRYTSTREAKIPPDGKFSIQRAPDCGLIAPMNLAFNSEEASVLLKKVVQRVPGGIKVTLRGVENFVSKKDLAGFSNLSEGSDLGRALEATLRRLAIENSNTTLYNYAPANFFEIVFGMSDCHIVASGALDYIRGSGGTGVQMILTGSRDNAWMNAALKTPLSKKRGTDGVGYILHGQASKEHLRGIFANTDLKGFLLEHMKSPKDALVTLDTPHILSQLPAVLDSAGNQLSYNHTFGLVKVTKDYMILSNPLSPAVAVKVPMSEANKFSNIVVYYLPKSKK